MKLFGKKKKSEDEEDDELAEERTGRRRMPRSKDFKDLSPENSRKRKTPPKPWGKKERMTVFITLLITVALSLSFYVSSKSWHLPLFANLSESWKGAGMGGKGQVLEGSEAEQNKAKKVIAAFNESSKKLSGVYGFYLFRLDNATGYGVRQDEIFQAASLLKLPVMVAMYREAEGNRLNLDAKYTLKEQDKLKGAGSLSDKPVGYELSYRNIVRLMGKQSDNTAYNIAKKLLGEDKINSVMAQAGMERSSIKDNKTTPYDIAVFYQSLWSGDLVGDNSKDELLEFLTDTVFEDWIAAGVTDVRVAHKFGRLSNVVNDAGIVFADPPYVLVLMGEGIIQKEANDFYPEFSATVFSVESQN